MSLFDVYPVFDINLIRGKGSYVYDENGNEYLDLYGGHAVISIGHSHPVYVNAIQDQVEKLGFYSNSVINQLQENYSNRLAAMSGYPDHSLFMVNSGAEATENALKLASFHTKKSRIISFKDAFHGRTTGAVAATDNPKILPSFGKQLPVTKLPLDDLEKVEIELAKNDVAAVIIEGIQGVAGINEPSTEFFKGLKNLTEKYNSVLILDEVQSGFGRSGKFFAHQYAGIEADIITCAKGMGNGFPVGGILIHPKFKASYGLLGTTFGGNHLACAAANAVLDVIENENLIQNSVKIGTYIIEESLKFLRLEQTRGKGLMIGFELNKPIKELRKNLIFNDKIFTGSSANPNVIRLLPALNVTKTEIDKFLKALKKEIDE